MAIYVRQIMSEKINLKTILEMVSHEMENPSEQQQEKKPDHEGRMAKSEIRSLITNSLKLYKIIDRNDELPGWVSAYITLSSDYINSVTQYMVEEKVADEEVSAESQEGDE